MDSKASFIPSKTSSSSPVKVPWTTARCNRLLRPLKTRLDAIRKHVAAQATAQQHQHQLQRKAEVDQKAKEQASASDRAVVRHETLLPTPGPVKSASSVSATPLTDFLASRRGDPDWVPDAARRQCKRKYSAKGADASGLLKKTKLNVARTALPGEISVPTPLLSRTQSIADYSSSQLLVRSTIEDGMLPDGAEQGKQGQKGRTEGGRKGRKKRWLWPKCHVLLEGDMGNKTSEQLKLFNSLLEASENLLRATMPKTSSFMTGPRSLFTTCLRQMPRFIALEHFFRKEENPDYKEDTASDIFESLETLSSAPGRGWTSLREVVRAQAVFLLQQAIMEGSLTLDMVKALGSLFAKLGAHTEAQELVTAYLQGQSSVTHDTDNRVNNVQANLSLQIFTHISTSVPKDIAQAFAMRALESALRSGSLPVQKVATKQMSHIWSHYVIPTVIHPGIGSGDAEAFISTTVHLACGLERLVSIPAMLSDSTLDSGFLVQPSVQESALDPRDALSNTVSSLLSIIASIILTGKDRPEEQSTDESSYELAGRILYSLALDVAITYDIRKSSTLRGNTSHHGCSQAQASRCATVIMTMILVTVARSHDSTMSPFTTINTCVELLEYISSQQTNEDATIDILEGLPKFICGIASCYARLHWTDDATDHLRTFANQLLLPNYDKAIISTQSVIFLRRLALDTVSQYARGAATKAEINARHKLVDEIELFIEQHPLEGMHKRASLRKSCVNEPAFDDRASKPGEGYRWEPGLAEWIAATPLKGLGKVRLSLDRITPPPPKRKIVFEEENTYDSSSHDSLADPLESFDELGFSEDENDLEPAPPTNPAPLKLKPSFLPRKALVNRANISSLDDGHAKVKARRARLAGLSTRLLADVTNTRGSVDASKDTKAAEHSGKKSVPMNGVERRAVPVEVDVPAPAPAPAPAPVSMPASASVTRENDNDDDELALSPFAPRNGASKRPVKLKGVKSKKAVLETRVSLALASITSDDDFDELSFCD